MVYWPAFGVAPQDPGEGRAPRCGHILDAAQGAEPIVLPTLDRKCLCPVTIESFAPIGAKDQEILTAWTAARFEFERRSDLIARRFGLPAVGSEGLICGAGDQHGRQQNDEAQQPEIRMTKSEGRKKAE